MIGLSHNRGQGTPEFEFPYYCNSSTLLVVMVITNGGGSRLPASLSLRTRERGTTQTVLPGDIFRTFPEVNDCLFALGDQIVDEWWYRPQFKFVEA